MQHSEDKTGDRGDADAAGRLKALRQDMRLSQREFGEPLGFNQAAVSAFEQGRVILKKPDALVVEYLYGVRHEWLLGGQGPKVRESEELTEDERDLLRVHREMNYKDRPTWLKIGRMLGLQNRNGLTERRGGDRRQGERRAADPAGEEPTGPGPRETVGTGGDDAGAGSR